MINVKRSIIIIKLLLIFFSLILIGMVINKTLSKYETASEISGNVQAAFYILDVGHQSTTIQMPSIEPSNEEYRYTFSVSNNDGTKRSETSLEYDLEIVTTTNLPLTYELYIEKEEQSIENCITNTKTIQDEYNTYFKVIETATESFTHTENKTNIYTLIIRFMGEYNSVYYKDIIEGIEININSRQII